MSDLPDYQHLAVASFMEKADQHGLYRPGIPCVNIRKLRAALILEEALEAVNALGFCALHKGDHDFIEMKTIELDCVIDADMRLIADACGDIKVVVVGTEIACGINGRPVFNEIMDSNMTKDFSGSKRGDGKIMKGKNYRPPNIDKVLREQGWRPNMEKE